MHFSVATSELTPFMKYSGQRPGAFLETVSLGKTRSVKIGIVGHETSSREKISFIYPLVYSNNRLESIKEGLPTFLDATTVP